MTSEAPERISALVQPARDGWNQSIGIPCGQRAFPATNYIRADLHQQALAEAEARGYARAVKEATEIAQRHEDHEGLDQDGNPYVSEEAHLFGASVAYEIKQEIRALSPTPADPVAEAAILLADHMRERRWQYYPIEMPLTKDGQGPATLGDDAVSVSYEVWEAGTLRTVSSHDYLPDAIEAALRALAQKEGE